MPFEQCIFQLLVGLALISGNNIVLGKSLDTGRIAQAHNKTPLLATRLEPKPTVRLPFTFVSNDLPPAADGAALPSQQPVKRWIYDRVAAAMQDTLPDVWGSLPANRMLSEQRCKEAGVYLTLYGSLEGSCLPPMNFLTIADQLDGDRRLGPLGSYLLAWAYDFELPFPF